MPSVLAIVSKAVFDKDAKGGGKIAGVGDVVPFEKYAQATQALASPSSAMIALQSSSLPNC